MPYKSVWVKPEVFMRYKGMVFYYTYRYNESDGGVSEYHFTTNEENTDYKEGDDGSETMFDVRDLETWQEPPHPQYITGPMTVEKKEQLEAEWRAYHASGIEKRYVKMAIRNAIKAGLLVDGKMLTVVNP